MTAAQQEQVLGVASLAVAPPGVVTATGPDVTVVVDVVGGGGGGAETTCDSGPEAQPAIRPTAQIPAARRLALKRKMNEEFITR
jgi:hypothetical protein